MAGQGENGPCSSSLPLSSRVVGRALRLPSVVQASDALALQSCAGANWNCEVLRFTQNDREM
jgi:hypothetical protein